MSIFKDTLHPFVQNQLEARKQIVSQYGKTGIVDGVPLYRAGLASRKEDFLRFTTGKNAWVKMQSFVDIVNIEEKNNKPVNVGLKIGSKTYYGDQLARKYILEGGTLFEEKDTQGKGINKFTLRSGVGLKNSVYASDIDIGGDRPFGYRPMPGITSAQINNKSAYGSLREATIKFYCWDKHQLEELELLYLRTGYSVLLEWGWSQYLNSSDLDNVKIENFLTPTIDIFTDSDILNPKDNTSDEVIYNKIDTLHNKSYGNYDAMLGYIRNFSWQLMENGGFDCSTTLVSRGELISTLKLNSNGPGFTIDVNLNAPPLSLFENVILNYTALINEGELNIDSRGLVEQVGQFVTGSSPVREQTKKDLLVDLNTRLDNVILKDYNNKNYSADLKLKLNSNDYGKILLTEGNIDGIGIEYVQMDVFISLINLYFNFKDQNNKVISQIIIPGSTPCLAGVDSISIDPTTCIIYNNKATWITDNKDGAFPKTLNSFLTLEENTADKLEDINDEQFLTNGNLGKIGNIFISIPKILDIYRSKGGNNTDVSIIDFLKDLLNQISKALGGINDFQLHTTKSTIQIIDVKYLERGAGDKKYILDLLGLKSVCRDVKITSRIFESQSSMIGIAAQSRANIGDIYSSTQNHLNKGLQDRILVDKVIYNENLPTATDKAKQSFGNLLSLRNYLGLKCLGTPSSSGKDLKSIIYPTPEEITNAASLQKTVMLQANSDDLDFKAIIPFELEIVLDGIAGLVQGQIFKIDTSILPSRYHQSNVGFIITGLSHSLQNNDWTTSIKAQICLLDNENIPRLKIDKEELGKTSIIEDTRKTNIIIWNVVADYMTNIYINFYKIIENKKYNEDLISTTNSNPFIKTTPREAMIAYRKADAGVYNFNPPKTNMINQTDEYGNDSGVRFFTSPYRAYGFMYQLIPDQTGTYKAGGYVVGQNLDRRLGLNYAENNEYNKTFGYMVSPNIQEYFNKVWSPAAKKRYKDEPDKIKLIDALAKNGNLNNSVKSIIELSTKQTTSIPLSRLEEVINKFISYPVQLAESNSKINVRKATGKPIPLLLKDNFMLRSPEYVNYIKEGGKTTYWDGDPNAVKYFNINPITFFIEEGTKDKDGKAIYNYKPQLKNNIDVFNQCYRYICDNAGINGYFDSLPVEVRPVASDLGDSNVVFSAFH